MPTWLERYLLKEAKLLRKTKNISHIKPLFKTLNPMRKELGLQETLKLLSHTQNFKELKGVAKLSKRYKKETRVLLKLSNKQLLTQANVLNKIEKKTITLASSYGSSGFRHLITKGEKRFLKATKRLKAYSKIGYKTKPWKIFLWLMKHLNNLTLLFLMATSALLLLPFRRLLGKTT